MRNAATGWRLTAWKKAMDAERSRPLNPESNLHGSGKERHGRYKSRS